MIVMNMDSNIKDNVVTWPTIETQLAYRSFAASI